MSPVLTLKLNAVQVLALAAFGLVMGVWIKRFIPVLDRLHIPASIVGGLVYALLALFLRDRWLNLEMDMVLRDILMVAFFTTIGMSASLRLVRVGGIQVVLFFAIAMGIGTLISTAFERAGAILPAYVGAMIAAAVIRNVDDWHDFFRLSQEHVDHIGAISLNVFIVMALLTLRLWELVHLALPMILMLVAQVALVWLMCMLLCFRLMGRDYEAAVMAGGFCGFMLGTTANAMACMGVLTEKYGPAPRAFIVVPLVGAFLIDFTNALIITAMANLLR